jgi:ATP-binding cassette subfamily B protein
MSMFSRTALLGEGAPESSGSYLLKKVLKELLAYKWAMAWVITSVILYSLTSLATPYILGLIIDRYILAGNLAGLPPIAGLYLALLIIQWLALTVNTYEVQTVGQLYLRDLRNAVFRKLQFLSMRFYSGKRIGDLVSAAINDTSTLNDVLVSGLLSVMGSMVSLVGIIAMMFYLSPSMTIIALSNIPLIVWIAKVFGRKLKEAHRVARKRVAETTMIAEESISGVQAVKAFSREEEVVRTFTEISAETSRSFVRIGKLMGVFWPSMDLSVTISVVLVLIYGAYLVSAGILSVGVVIAFIQYVNRLGRPITQFVNMYDSLQAALAAAERIYAVRDSDDVEDYVSGQPMDRAEGEIRLENVTFSYVPGRPVLKDVTLTVRSGNVVALVGHTGAGKTTLISLIMRFYKPDKGKILLDGKNIADIRLTSLRRLIAYVPQETYLFPGTVLDNIRLGRPEATDEEVVNVCKELGIHEFIERLPKGYFTDAGEMGKRLSTGEKQLVAIARAMLRNPAIVIMDEALSSVDPGTESMIRSAMRRLMSGRTGIIVAHRLTTASEADKVIVLENGKVVEEGRHEELLARRGAYYRLYTSTLTSEQEIESFN